MSDTHIFGGLQQAEGVKDVRSVRNVGSYGRGMAARIKDLGLEP